jgi:RNA polymerase sigma factor (sigma-70 family)
MMEKNEGLVVSKAKIYWEGIYSSGMDKSLTQDDFIQLARIELWKAIDKFKPELGNKFSTYAGVCIENKLKSVVRSVKSRYERAGGELVSLEKYAGTEEQLTYDEKYFDPYQHEPEEIAIRHDHSQWIFYALLDLPQRERTFTIYRYNYPNWKKRSQGKTARHFYLSRVREKNLERTARELFMKNYFRKQRMKGT